MRVVTENYETKFPFFNFLRDSNEKRRAKFSLQFPPSKMVVVVKRVYFSLFAVKSLLKTAQMWETFNDFHSSCVKSLDVFMPFDTLAAKLTFNFQLLFHHFVYEIVMSFFCCVFFQVLLENSNFSRSFFTLHSLNCLFTAQNSLKDCLKVSKFHFFTNSHTESDPREISVSEFSHNTARKIFQH